MSFFRGGMALVCIGFVLASCATNNPYQKMDEAVKRDAYQQALDEIVSAQTVPKGKKAPSKPLYKESNRISMYLDKGLLGHYAGDYESSYQDLTSAEQAIEEAYTKSITDSISSYIANDNSKEYAGEDYEDVYVNIFNALNSYHLKNGQAYALVNDLVAQGGELQVLVEKYGQDESKIKQFLENATNAAGVVFSLGTVQWPAPHKINFTNSALARYLGAVFSLADGNKDMARYHLFELTNAFSTPLYADLNVPEALAVSGDRGDETGPLLDIPRGKGQLNVLAFAGLAPIKKEATVQIPFPSFQFPKVVPPALKVPTLVERPSIISDVKVSIEPSGSVDMVLLEDMGAVITDTFKGHYSSVLAKTFARVLAKYVTADITAYAAARMVRERGMPELLALAAGTAVLNASQAALNATEGADIRMGRYFPSKAYIGAVNLDPGVYTVTVSYLAGGRVVEMNKTVEVTAGKISLVEAVCLK